MRTSLVLVALLAAMPARGDFWKQAQGGAVARERALRVAEGDRYLAEAQQRMTTVGDSSPTPPIVQSAARAALAAYERALVLGEDADVHYRAVFAAGFIDDRKGGICAACRDGFDAIVRHVDAIRRLDTASSQARELTWQSCFALSKLGGLGGPDADAHFERALVEYERWRSLVDELTANPKSISISYSNAAELLMALGRLDDSIDYYRRAIEANAVESLNYFGLAVAYDRDGQWKKAVAAMKTAVELAAGDLDKLSGTEVFFVPQGDVHYYYGLAHQVLGNNDVAIAAYKRFLARSPHNLYLDRAREHLQELEKGGAQR